MLAVQAGTLVLRRFADGEALFGRRGGADEAVRRGLLPPERASAWLASLGPGGADGSLFAAATLFAVAGRKA